MYGENGKQKCSNKMLSNSLIAIQSGGRKINWNETERTEINEVMINSYRLWALLTTFIWREKLIFSSSITGLIQIKMHDKFCQKEMPFFKLSHLSPVCLSSEGILRYIDATVSGLPPSEHLYISYVPKPITLSPPIKLIVKLFEFPKVFLPPLLWLWKHFQKKRGILTPKWAHVQIPRALKMKQVEVIESNGHEIGFR